MNKDFLYKVAFRNIRRKPQRTAFLILGLALANALTIWILTFRESSFKTMMENILGMKYGQEQVTRVDYYDFENGSLNPYKYFSKTDVSHLPPTYTLRTQSTVLVASDKNAIPLLLNGYDMNAELKLSKLGTLIPESFKFRDQFSLILGKRLAQALSVSPGDEVAVIGQAVDGSVANELFKVQMVVDLGGGEFEKQFAVTGLSDMQEFLSMPPDQVHLLVNFGEHFKKKSIPEGLTEVEWQKLLPEIASSSGFMESFTKFYAVFFALVASIAMANTLSLSFLERVKEYRMSKIVGAPVKWLRKSMAIEILIITSLGLIIGNFLILFAIGFFYFFPLNLSLLTGGYPLQMGGIILTQDVNIRPYGWIFLVSNFFFIFTLSLAAIYPMKVVLKKSETA